MGLPLINTISVSTDVPNVNLKIIRELNIYLMKITILKSVKLSTFKNPTPVIFYTQNIHSKHFFDKIIMAVEGI